YEVGRDTHFCDIRRLQEVGEEEALLVTLTPGELRREPGVHRGPRDDDGVVHGDDDADEHLPPSEWLGRTMHPSKRERRRPAEAVPDRIVEEQQRDAGRQQRAQVWDEE